VTEAPAALLDVDGIRSLAVSTLGVLRASPMVVLGSTQRVEDLDTTALARDGVTVRRRRGGGGAVLLRPPDCWIELWLPATSSAERGDVRSTAYRVGEWWQVALRSLGVACDVHHGAVVGAVQGAVACFAGLGPGELSSEGRKLVGLSQWRAREGALVSSVIAARSPSDLTAYLSSDAAPTPSLALATCLDEAIPGVVADDVAAAFAATVRREVSALALADAPFVATVRATRPAAGGDSAAGPPSPTR
jgi:hypothetical protein